MTFKHGTNKPFTTKYGEPYLWGSGDDTTIPSNENKVTVNDGAAADSFGESVAIGNGRIVIGADGDDVGSNSNQGSAYIFNLAGTQLVKITASDGAEGDRFGRSVAVGNGRIVVGATGDDDNGSSSGSAYIFNLAGTQLAKITASDGAASEFFGISVAVGNGRIVVGTIDRFQNFAGKFGAAYIFNLAGTQLAKITASDGAANDAFGDRVAIGNGRIVIGALEDDDNGSASGSAYIFDLNGTQLAKITASDGAAGRNFGHSVAIGNGRIVVGENDSLGNSQGSVYIFDLDGNELEKITASDGAANDLFGKSVAVGNGRIVIGASGDDDNGSASGSAYIYETPRVYTPYDLIYNEV